MLLEHHMPSATLAPTVRASAPPRPRARRPATPPRATDDEILGITSPRKNPPRNTQQLEFDFDAAPSSSTTLSSRARADVWPDEGPAVSFANDKRLQIPRFARNDSALGDANANNNPTVANVSADATTQSAAARASIPEPAHLRATFDANPELRAAWRDASAYRESFATPDAARQATALLADVNHMDALFFSHRPEDHASLARAIANLDPAAFTSLANAMQTIAAKADGLSTAGLRPAPLPSPSVGARHAVPERDAWHDAAHSPSVVIPSEASALSSSGPAPPVRATRSRGTSLLPRTPNKIKTNCRFLATLGMTIVA